MYYSRHLALCVRWNRSVCTCMTQCLQSVGAMAGGSQGQGSADSLINEIIISVNMMFVHVQPCVRLCKCKHMCVFWHICVFHAAFLCSVWFRFLAMQAPAVSAWRMLPLDVLNATLRLSQSCVAHKHLRMREREREKERRRGCGCAQRVRT
jgi:hypothetical protein